MEPAAPGTEDEVLLIAPTVSKKVSEQQRLLSLKAYLPSGKYGNIFELNYQNGSEYWYCNACQCPVMGRVYQHEIGKRHTNNLEERGTIQAQPQLVSTEEEQTTIQIAPGEPVPPGFEGEIEKVCEIQERLDAYTVGPLIGLEYVLELQEYDRDKEPGYLCTLCDKKGDPRTVVAHLASYNHINQYLQKHFPSCYRALSPYSTKQYKRNWQNIVHQIAEAIENRFGRLKPRSVEMEAFEKKRQYYWEMVLRGPHFSEKSGITFEEMVKKEELTKNLEEESTINKPSERIYRKTGTVPGTSEPSAAKPAKKRSPSPPVVARPSKKPKARNATPANAERRRSLSSVSSISSSDLDDFEPDKDKKNGNRNRSPVNRRNRSRSPQRPRQGGRGRGFRRSPSPRGRPGYRPQKDSRLPWQRPDYQRPRSDFVVDNRNKQKTDKTEEYKKLATAIENDMSKVLKQHEKNPEKHPQYNDEWKKFWNRRYKELQAEGKDASKHDFKPEWILFWNKRMVELHNTEVKAKKDALRKRLGLPDEPAPICFRITGKKKPSPKEKQSSDSKPTKPMAANPDTDDAEVIVIDDKEDDTRSSMRSHSPWETEPVARVKVSRDRSRDRSWERDDRRSRSPGRDHRGRDRRSRDRDPLSRDRDPRSRDRDPRGRDHDARSRDRDPRARDSLDLSPMSDARPMMRERDFRRDKSWERDAYRGGDPYRREMMDVYKPPRVMRDVTRQPVHSPPMYPPPVQPQMAEPEPDEDDGDINIVGVLRLLTALEEKLGSLGPKVIDLLAQALAMEKNEANSSETLLDNEVNCVLFETVKEKLKGQLLAGLVEYTQEKPFKNAIRKIASLIHFAGQRKKQRQSEVRRVDPVKVPGVGTVDKAAIAKQIATALVLQGKTDVSQQELEQLINAVVGMAEASRNSNKPMTTASFLQTLTQTAQPSKPAEQPKPTTSFTETIREPMSDALQALQGNDTSSMDGLSDSDLQTLLQNFKDLSTTEQHGLITYLKKLEAKEPERVEKLRKFVNLGGQEPEKSEVKKESGRLSPFSNRLEGGNPMVEEKTKLVKYEIEEDEDEEGVKKLEKKEDEKAAVKVSLDSDDEEYSFEDVFKVAKEKVQEKEEEKKRLKEEIKADADLKDAKAIIANLMGSLGAKNASSSNLLGLQPSNPVPASTSSAPQTSGSSSATSIPLNIISNIKISPATVAPPALQNAPRMAAQALPSRQPNPQNPIQSIRPQFQNRPPYASQNVQYPIQNNAPGAYGGNFGQNARFPAHQQQQHHHQNVQYPINRPSYQNNQGYNAYEQEGGYNMRGNPNQNQYRPQGNYNNRW